MTQSPNVTNALLESFPKSDPSSSHFWPVAWLIQEQTQLSLPILKLCIVRRASWWMRHWITVRVMAPAGHSGGACITPERPGTRRAYAYESKCPIQPVGNRRYCCSYYKDSGTYYEHCLSLSPLWMFYWPKLNFSDKLLWSGRARRRLYSYWCMFYIPGFLWPS